jgi:hypothetical protein
MISFHPEVIFAFINQVIADTSGKNILYVFWYFFIHGVWIFFIYPVGYLLWTLWIDSRQTKYLSTINYTYLSVDIPADNEQMPKAVEQIFATIAGAHASMTKGEEWWEGKVQLFFSFELVGIDGYLSYIIRTPTGLKEVVRSAIFAQYPQAEITEVEDYAKNVPTTYPDEKYNVWGAELILSNKQYYPIKTYPEFEEKLMGEFKDPMAAVLETMSNLQRGEQVWLQIIVKPIGFEWVADAKKFVDKLAGKKATPPKPAFGPLSGVASFFGDWISYNNTITTATKPEEKKKDEPVSKMLYLTPGEREALEAVEKKASKIGFKCKIRLVYIAEKEIFSTQRVISSVFGSIKQFNSNHLNGLKPDGLTKTSAYYGWGLAKRKKARRQTNIVRNYISRSGWAGRDMFILNTEELATLYHFPIMTVKAPQMPKLEMKKSEPPSYLPLASSNFDEGGSSNLREELDQLNMSNTHYEQRYGANRNQRPATQHEADEEDSTPDTVPHNLPLG